MWVTIPVFPDADAEEAYQNKLKTAIQERLGVGEHRIRFELEPVCAAIDFLQHKDTWELNLESGQLLCVFDCGAGTADVCILEADIAADGSVDFKTKLTAGFPIGGDAVDARIVDSALEGLQKRTTGQDCRLEIGPNPGEYRIFNGAKPKSLRRRELLLNVRIRKEDLKYPGDPQIIPPQIDPKHLIVDIPVSYGLTDQHFTDLVDRALGFGAESGWKKNEHVFYSEADEPVTATQDFPSLKAVCIENDIAPDLVRWVCLTGGSSTIPSLVQGLRNLFTQATIVPSDARLGEITGQGVSSPLPLNVVQGAALRYQYRMEGLLPWSFGYRCLDANHEGGGPDVCVLLAANVPPGASTRQERVVVRAQSTLVLELLIEAGDGVWMPIYRQELANAGDDFAPLIFHLEYALDGAILLRAHWVRAVNGQAARVSLFYPDQKMVLVK